ncbi:defense against restriction DarA-related protein [Psychrobacter celer]|uniref:defense against restriction DarA-related protein n=1 Tax=Psychrobacter celer TaxID=306572 RepID=UPI003FD66165
MAYITLNKAHTHHRTTINGQPANQYSRYETGLITGSKRNLPAILADNTGSDGYGFDSAVGSDDDSWHVLNAFDKRGSYVDTIAVGGAMDSDHALVVAQTQLDSLGASSFALIGAGLTQFDSLNQQKGGTFSIDAINKLMDNSSQDKNYLPIITISELTYEADRVTFDSVRWGENSNELLSHDGRDSTLMLDMTRADTRSDLVNEFELADVLDLLGAEPEQSFDALMDTKNRLGLLKDRLYNAMSRASNDTVSVTNVTETKPFKRQGVTNIAFVFDLSDGQKLSIWFHNPDSTPSKLMPSDIMISWKWMLNKRDVTAALSPKQGDNVQLPVLASRIMRVAAKNSVRFKRTQARRLKLEQNLLDAQALIDTKIATIEQLDKDIESLTSQIDAAMKAPKVASVVEPVVEPVMEPSVVDETVAEPAGQQVDANNPILELKGDELGEFEESPEGKKQLRAAAKDEFNKLRGQWILCPSLSAAEGENAKIEIRKRGIKEFMAFSGDSRKLKLVAKIAEIIKTATLSTNSWQDNEKLDKKPMVAGYYHLENKISIDGEIIELRVLIEKDQKGLLHYDVILPKHEVSFDNLEQKNVLETAIPDNDSGVASSTLNIKSPNDEDVNQEQTMFDKATPVTADGVLNMFILNDTSTEDTVSGDESIEAEGTDKELTDIDGNEASTTNPNNKKITKGKSNKAKTPKGTKIESVFALVDAKFLIASHTANGSKNPKYPQELQPRDRARESSIAWVQKTSKELDPESLGRTGRVDTGAPIVGDDLVVESGNGRTIAIKMAYANGDAGEYREWLAENADMFGMTAKQVESYKQPILVRVRTTDVNRSEFAVEANQDDKLSFTASERAKSDAKRVNAGMLELFDPSESGDILAASNRDFVKSFLASLGATEAAQYTDSNGNPTQALVARIKGALFSKAYDDDRLLEMMADQTKPDLQNTLNALTMAAPNFVAAQSVNRSDAQDLAEKVVDSVEQSLSDEVKNAIVDATNMIMNAKISNQDIKEYVLQQGLFEQVDDSVAELAVFLAANARSAKKMTDYFNAMASYIEKDSVSRQNLDMFGEPEPLSLADVIAHANSKASENTDTIGSLDMFKETAVDETVESAPQDSNPPEDLDSTNLAAKVDDIVNKINSNDFDAENFDVDALIAIADEAESNNDLTAKLEAASEVYQNKLITIAMQAMSDMVGN